MENNDWKGFEWYMSDSQATSQIQYWIAEVHLTQCSEIQPQLVFMAQSIYISSPLLIILLFTDTEAQLLVM